MRDDLFIEWNGKIMDFLKKQDIDYYALPDKEFKLPLSDAVFCAEDTVRNLSFFQAIRKAMEEISESGREAVVVDAGSGTGILGVFALALGASKCYFLEHNPHSLRLSEKLVSSTGFAKKSVFVECDATSYELPEPYDLLICETISSGFVTEDFPAIINHLRKSGQNDARFIPEKFEVIMTEKDENNDPLAQRFFSFLSREGFRTEEVHLQDPGTKHLSFQSKAFLFGNITLRSGEAMSFLNEQTLVPGKAKHPFFRFITKGRYS